MKLKHLDHLNLTVLNFEKTADWYHRVFGFETVEEGLYAGEPWGVIRSGEAMLCIYQTPKRRVLDDDEMKRQGFGGMQHFALRITNRKEWEKIIVNEGIAIEYGGVYRWPHSHAWYIRDPNGYRIEVVLWDGDRIQF